MKLLNSEIDLKHGCVAAGYQCGETRESGAFADTGNQTGNQSQHTIDASIALVGGVVELGTNIDEAIGFEPESVWPVIAMLWDIHGYKGVYDMGVIGVWMQGIGKMLYVCGIDSITGVMGVEV